VLGIHVDALAAAVTGHAGDGLAVFVVRGPGPVLEPVVCTGLALEVKEVLGQLLAAGDEGIEGGNRRGVVVEALQTGMPSVIGQEIIGLRPVVIVP
jgi:hypothetical protein